MPPLGMESMTKLHVKNKTENRFSKMRQRLKFFIVTENQWDSC